MKARALFTLKILTNNRCSNYPSFKQRYKEDEYRTSWLELFFDLVFVAMVAQLTYHFSRNYHTLEDFIQVGLIGYMIFLAGVLLMVVTFNLIRSTLAHHPFEAIKSISGFLVGLIGVVLTIVGLGYSVYAMVIGVSAWVLMFVALDYRKHFGRVCVIH